MSRAVDVFAVFPAACFRCRSAHAEGGVDLEMVDAMENWVYLCSLCFADLLRAREVVPLSDLVAATARIGEAVARADRADAAVVERDRRIATLQRQLEQQAAFRDERDAFERRLNELLAASATASPTGRALIDDVVAGGSRVGALVRRDRQSRKQT